MDACVARRSNTGRAGEELGSKREVYLSLRVANGGGVVTRRVTGKDPEKS